MEERKCSFLKYLKNCLKYCCCLYSVGVLFFLVIKIFIQKNFEGFSYSVLIHSLLMVFFLLIMLIFSLTSYYRNLKLKVKKLEKELSELEEKNIGGIDETDI